MIPQDVVVVFFLASVALALAPGPDNLFVLTQSALHGVLPGVAVTLGLCTGLMVHTIAVTLGAAALFATSVVAFTVVKLGGAAYLLYLAWQCFKTGKSDLPMSQPEPIPLMRLYRRGVIMNITNPKVAIFFLAFLPQFADPARGSITLQLIMLGCVFVVAAFTVFCCIAWFSGYLGHWLKRSKHAHAVLNRIAGVVFTALAIRLLFVER